MNKNIKLNTRWFALKKEDGQGIEHRIVHIDGGENEEGGVLTEPEIITFSDHNCTKTGGGFTWRGEEKDFLTRFKFIGFPEKK